MSEQMFFDTDGEVLNDEICRDLIERIQEIKASDTRPESHLNEDAFRYGLREFKDREYVENIVEFNKSGWPITSVNVRDIKCVGVKENYKAKIESIREGLRKLLSRVEKQYIWGPWEESLLPDSIEDPTYWPQFYKNEYDTSNPKTRILTNFSDESLGQSFNQNLTESDKTTKYISIIDCVWLIVACNLKWLWAIDAHEAYYRVPIQSKYLKFMGFKLCGMIFFYTCLVMGMASACRIYTEFADIVAWIIVNNHKELFIQDFYIFGNAGKYLLLHYIDDFFGGHETRAGAQAQFKAVINWWKWLGIPTQLKKCIAPTRRLVYLGYVLDTISNELSITEKRMKKYKAAAVRIKRAYNERKRVKVVLLQRMVGQFRSMQVVYPYIIPWLRSWEEKTALMDKNEYTYITDRMIDDLQLIELAIFDLELKPMPFWWLVHPKYNCDVEVFTDASTGIGVGGYIKQQNAPWFKRAWTNTACWDNLLQKPDIVFMELLGVVLAAKLYGSNWTNKAVTFRCDNWGACAMVRKKCACFRRPDLNQLLKHLCSLAVQNRFYFWIEHVPGKYNVVADKLSRFLKLLKEDLPIGVTLEPNETTCDYEIDALIHDCWIKQYGLLNATKCSCDMLDKSEWKLHELTRISNDAKFVDKRTRDYALMTDEVLNFVSDCKSD